MIASNVGLTSQLAAEKEAHNDTKAGLEGSSGSGGPSNAGGPSHAGWHFDLAHLVPAARLS